MHVASKVHRNACGCERGRGRGRGRDQAEQECSIIIIIIRTPNMHGVLLPSPPHTTVPVTANRRETSHH